MANKSVWWSDHKFYALKRDALKTEKPIMRIDCPCYCNPQQLVGVLNTLDKSLFK